MTGAALIVAVGVVGAVDGIFTDGPTWVPIAFAGICVLAVLFALRVRVVATEPELLVHNPLSTHRIAWADIDGFNCDRFLVVRLKNGTRLSCVGVPQSGVTRLFGRLGGDNKIADALEHRRLAATGGVPPTA
ncbi:PH domain-containing protein [Embleya sp. NPDC050493]|uniref:PH domain-containing protein n=1 Tax=Embleya sp. NPDC050493 TaxID=3363989 RepID=UPI00378981B0